MDEWTPEALSATGSKKLFQMRERAARKVLFLNGKGNGVSFHQQAVLWDARRQAVLNEIEKRRQEYRQITEEKR